MKARRRKKEHLVKETGKVNPWTYVILLGAMALAVIILNRAGLVRVFHQPFAQTILYADEMKDGGAHLSKSARLEGTFSFTPSGLALKPGDSFRATFDFSKALGKDVTLFAGLRGYDDVTNGIEVVLPDGITIGFPSGDYQLPLRLLLPSELRGYREFRVVVSAARNPGRSAPPIAVFNGLKVVAEDFSPLINLPALLAVIVASLIAYSLLVRIEKLRDFALVLSAGLFLTMMAEVHYGGDLYFPAFLCALILVVLGWLLYVRKPDRALWRALLRYSLLLILIIALRLRWDALPEAMSQPLSADAVTYAALARQMRGPFDTGIREPLFIWATKLCFWLFGNYDSNLQIMTVFLSLATIVLAYVCAARMFHSLAGLFAALFLAASRGYIYQNLRGLRLELYVLILLIVVLLLWRGTKMKPLHRAIALGVVCGLALLNNISALSYLVILVIYFGARQRWAWWRIILPLVIASVMVSPHLLHNKRESGDAFYSSNIHARYYRNAEFQGQPGFPTADEVQKDAYAGKRISTTQYIFGLHTVPEVIRRSIAGFGRIYFGDHLRTFILDDNLTLYCIYLLGLFTLIVTRQFDFLLVMFIVNVPSFFLAGTPAIDFDFRLTMHDIGFITMCMGAGVVVGISLLVQKYNEAITSVSNDANRRQDKQRDARATE
jgi:hypothetical protein